jgi:hypothetical protein
MPSAEVRCPICRLRVRVSSAQMMRIDPASKCQNKQGLDRLPEPEAGAGRGTAPIGRFKISRGIIGTESRRSTPTIELALEAAYCGPSAKLVAEVAMHVLATMHYEYHGRAIP